MAVSVTIHHKVFSSPKVDLLGDLCGYNRWEAIGRLAMLWSVCADRETDTPGDKEIMCCLGLKGPDAIVLADFGEKLPSGEVRVRGCAERHAWVKANREKSSAGGRARVASAQRDDLGRLKSPSPRAGGGLGPPGATSSDHQPEPARPPASEIRDQGSGDLSISGGDQQPPGRSDRSARKRARSTKGETPLPADWAPTDEHRARAAASGLDVDREADRFKARALSKGLTYVNWNAAFTTWLINAPDFSPKRASGQPQLDAFERQMQRVAELEAQEKP